MTQPHSRRTDSGDLQERRRAGGDRRSRARYAAGVRFPTLREQVLQYAARYLFAGLGLLFFNVADGIAPTGLTLWQLNTFLYGYLLVNSLNLLHAWRHPASLPRFRFTLWMDIVTVTVCVANDPYVIPPSLVAYIVVVLGNGMRYGMRLFAESLVASFAGGAIAMAIRHVHWDNVLSPGTVFLSLFGAIIVVYAYILMGRIERSRRYNERMSRTDALTGLLNRRGLFESGERLMRSKRSGRGLVLLFADLDNFKTVNDTHGHAAGDRVLQEIATLLRGHVRPTDLVARYGGDEFVLLMPDITIEEADGVAKRLQSAIGAWAQRGAHNCGMSLGLGVVPEGELDLMRVLEAVDKIMYRSKSRRARGTVEYLAIPQSS